MYLSLSWADVTHVVNLRPFPGYCLRSRCFLFLDRIIVWRLLFSCLGNLRPGTGLSCPLVDPLQTDNKSKLPALGAA